MRTFCDVLYLESKVVICWTRAKMAAAYLEQYFDCTLALSYLSSYRRHKNDHFLNFWQALKRCLWISKSAWLDWERLRRRRKVKIVFINSVINRGTCFIIKDLCGKIERSRLDFLAAVRSGNGDRQKVLFRELQQCMLDAREVGNTKLEISAQLLDIVSTQAYLLTCGT